MRVVEAFIGRGAAGMQLGAWCLLCAEQLVYLGPVQVQANRFSVIPFQVCLQTEG